MLGFGFWRFLLARRYTARLWPALRPPSPFARLRPGPARVRVAGLHVLPNRVAHREPQPLGEPLTDRYTNLLGVVGSAPQLRTWLDTHNRLLTTLAGRP